MIEKVEASKESALLYDSHTSIMSESESAGFQAALEEARQGLEEGGIPIGSALLGKNGKILGRGHNMRMQKGSTILHVCVCISMYRRHRL